MIPDQYCTSCSLVVLASPGQCQLCSLLLDQPSVFLFDYVLISLLVGNQRQFSVDFRLLSHCDPDSMDHCFPGQEPFLVLVDQAVTNMKIVQHEEHLQLYFHDFETSILYFHQ